VGDALAPGRQEPRHLLHLYTVRSDGHFVTPRQTLESAVQWCIEMVGRAAELPVAHRAGRVRGHPPALPIVVGGPAIATSGSVTSARTAQDRTRAVSRGSTPLPITRPPPTAQRRGKGGPKAHPGGTRKRPSRGRRGWRHSAGMGRVPPPGAASDAAAAASSQSAHSPQMVRKTPRNGQHRPTGTNGKCAAQPPFSVTAHCAKPPLGRFCKAGVRGSIPLVSTHAMSRRRKFVADAGRLHRTAAPSADPPTVARSEGGSIVPRRSVAEWSRD
jgi:hypothetical protein